MAKLYLIPTTLTNPINNCVIPNNQLIMIKHLKYFIVETAKIGRIHIKLLNLDTKIQDLNIVELNKHANNIEQLLEPLLKNNDVGLLSDCGLPCVADPGNIIVAHAHKNNIEVIPLFGSSSLLLGLMASGLNGQSFSFNGYFPIEEDKRKEKIKQISKLITHDNQTQIFIETPFRNQQLLKYLVNNLKDDIILVLAINLMQNDQQIIRYSINNWKKLLAQYLIHKKEVVFILGA
jgi:16S rRNA (cytidine1402-2'-O)-methyltransferase